MKKIIISIGIFLLATTSFSQTKKNNMRMQQDSILNRIDSLIQVTNVWLSNIEIDLSLKQRYKLYQTENIYTFLQLDTKTGMIEQVQWSLDSKDELIVNINSDNLNYVYDYDGSGSFELYSTKNMYQFILLDKATGRKWHIQWGMKDKERWIRRIY